MSPNAHEEMALIDLLFHSSAFAPFSESMHNHPGLLQRQFGTMCAVSTCPPPGTADTNQRQARHSTNPPHGNSNFVRSM
jgi:hypothetical protein